MSFARQKRLLLGWLALLAPLPLPFNDVVGWPAVGLYFAGVVFFLRRSSADPPRWLPLWGMNVLGLAYLPLFFIDLAAAHGLVGPVLHLCLFAVLVKLFAIVRERDKWQAAVGVFFLFLAAMGTSVHPAVVLYLIVFLSLTLVLLTRFAFLHVLAGFGREDPTLAHIPLRGFLFLTTTAVLALAVPLFLLLPRVRTPFIVGRGGSGLTIEAAGFSDQVTLDSIGRIRGSREVAMRVLEEGTVNPDREMRFKAASYDLYQEGTWRRSPTRGNVPRVQGLRFQLSPLRPSHWATIWLQPLRSSSLPLPVETTLVEPRARSLQIDEGGAVSLPITPLEVVEYRVGLARRSAVLTGSPPAGPTDPSLDPRGVTPRIAALAARVMGQGTAAERARRLENHLTESYAYTLSFVGRSTENPIEDFLFRYKSGQCEYFASAMVLMLRSQGIPARLVTGFLGGEYNLFEGYYIVRENNAHAWVEAYLPGEGWRIFDPTPPAGRPAEGGEGGMLLARQAWDFVLFRWDRYVLTFGLYDQLRIFGGLRDLWNDFWSSFRREEKRGTPSSSAGLDSFGSADPGPGRRRGLPDVPLPVALGLTLVATAVWILYLRLRPPLTATAAYRRLRRRIGSSLPSSVPPLTVRQEAEARYPAAAASAARVIDFYLRESFGGQPLEDEELEALKSALEEAEKKMSKAS
ncbi:MAG TPA: transglutaminaseTgpA domain-containing protein [Thermoanaerobaculia bacterium]|jgi:transglutaminase-like putative cysteine protease|nr:transglutaminaseTgpA domain-containing protein [Thermoanaerobaculia bacterium]